MDQCGQFTELRVPTLKTAQALDATNTFRLLHLCRHPPKTRRPCTDSEEYVKVLVMQLYVVDLSELLRAATAVVGDGS